ncbi:ACP S-malonyltransferase [Anaeroglobus geminatus]|jgi:[acyl-carrier-protein] S-malonyltransferase|uniref:Malonyl CoA-acyl carrier protein transacylase n=1 Tax=Anaeroglobus geminatus F0357 TaxID=861450 RepID=G9YF73_9FIRM|nr:ACP S-malonyltransferase [Anaeroglobus geminatus]EHM43241.1 [acyl-carrier-protein] S-malonyltransferase [Anaeroglobus geminatus F0357]
MKKAFVFPGQGAQRVGMIKDLYDGYASVRRLFEEADDALGFSLTRLCFEGPDEELMMTYNTQPAILTASTACSLVLQEEGLRPDIVAGHSLGEYSALVAAESVSFADAVRTVRQRGRFMQEAVPLGEGAMAAILGLDEDRIKAVCAEVGSRDGTVEAVNFNCPGQIVIAGAAKAVEAAVDALKAAGAKRAVMLNVSAPFHSTLMRPAAERLAEVLNMIVIKDAKVPVAANVDGQLETAAAVIKASLVRQAASPVLWIACVRQIQAFGAENIVEVGPGKTLTGFNRKIDKAIHCENVEDIPSLKKTLGFFQGGN